MLCGVVVPHDTGLAGHSDADVGIHALCDAIYGALAEGDIGRHFPPSEAQWKDADSARFLRHAAERIAARGGRLANADVTLICERPKITPHAPAMIARLAELLGVEAGRISVKATTTERLGFTGRGEGIAAQAVATVLLPVRIRRAAWSGRASGAAVRARYSRGEGRGATLRLSGCAGQFRPAAGAAARPGSTCWKRRGFRRCRDAGVGPDIGPGLVNIGRERIAISEHRLGHQPVAGRRRQMTARSGFRTLSAERRRGTTPGAVTTRQRLPDCRRWLPMTRPEFGLDCAVCFAGRRHRSGVPSQSCQSAPSGRRCPIPGTQRRRGDRVGFRRATIRLSDRALLVGGLRPVGGEPASATREKYVQRLRQQHPL